MGIYEIEYGKGIFVSIYKIYILCKDHIDKYNLSDLETKYKHINLEGDGIYDGKYDVINLFKSILKQVYNMSDKLVEEEFTYIFVGHDFFENGRDRDDNHIFDMYKYNDYSDDTRIKAIESIMKDIDECGTHDCFVFIGYSHDINGGMELEYRVVVPSIIYSIASFVPEIIRLHNLYKDKEFPVIIEELLDQPAHFWTFAGDCACCT